MCEMKKETKGSNCGSEWRHLATLQQEESYPGAAHFDGSMSSNGTAAAHQRYFKKKKEKKRAHQHQRTDIYVLDDTGVFC